MQKSTCPNFTHSNFYRFFVLVLIQLLLSAIFSQNLLAEEIPELNAEEISSIAERETQIIIKSNEKKTKVFVNNQFQGYATLKLTGLVEGTYFLRLEKSGYKTESALIEVEYGKSKTFYVQLFKLDSKN